MKATPYLQQRQNKVKTDEMLKKPNRGGKLALCVNNCIFIAQFEQN